MKPDETSPDAPRSERIRQQAAEWTVRRDAGFTAEEQDAFFEWLSADPQHAEAYAKLQAFYKRMNVMVEWRPLHALEPNPDLLAVSRRRFRRGRMLAWLGGMAALTALGFTLWREQPAAPAPLPGRLAGGGLAPAFERRALEDGSVVLLNHGAQVAVRFEPARRVLDLVSGEAYFQVAEDSTRPFVVRVSGIAVTAVGTEFNIALTSGSLEVLVTKGRVRVEPPLVAHSAPSAAPAAAERTLDAGHGVIMATDAPASSWIVAAYTPQVVAQKLAWKNDLVDFRALPLSEVILEFNRRNHTQLIIADEELTRLPITGSLRLTNHDRFLELLTVTHGIQIERHGTSKILLHRSR